MKAFKNLFGAVQKRITKANQWASIRARRGHRSQSQYNYQSDLEAAYAYGVEFPILHNVAESYHGFTYEENAPAPMTYDGLLSSTTTSQPVPIPDTILTIDAVSNLAEALSTDITSTINDQPDTHTSDPADEPLDSLSNSADAVISEPISAVGDAMTPGSISLKRRRMEVLDENINVSSETKVKEDHVHKRQKIALELSVSVGLDQSSLAGPHHNVHTLISFNAISPRHATENHLYSDDYEAPPTQISISIDHKKTRPQDISGLENNSLSTPAAGITSEPICHTANVEVFDQKLEVPPVLQRQTNESPDHPIILDSPRSPIFVEQPEVPMTPVHNHQNITSSDSMILGTPCTPVFMEQPIVPITSADDHQQIDSLDDAVILGTPCTPVNVKSSDDLMILGTPCTPAFFEQPKGLLRFFSSYALDIRMLMCFGRAQCK
ncbi:uncharacterized protein MELLADRAFT_79810 [Melampsora larici-populina 98AG31]|uniref:Uncharacterized protein n=1 Tax=Melampsora larici-populina (strain 98AG31 / pathotype 3-4-7) TaxID=747676 RepID=F4SC91_MELLP|nr:uncharacterized protein MELLADRAFT_79810 [Melampsora larici-populina 98AG31]EGF97742.1 hypothetical protein MELLADRAFT_79810 [Melampsora larici-populina 98AG31]